MIERAVFCRNYAEELRVKAAEKKVPECRRSLLDAAADLDRLAVLYENISSLRSDLTGRALVLEIEDGVGNKRCKTLQGQGRRIAGMR